MFVTTNLTTYLTTSPSHHLTTSPSHHLTITACTSSTAALAASTTPSASQASSATFSTICVAAYRPKSSPSARLPKQSSAAVGRAGCHNVPAARRHAAFSTVSIRQTAPKTHRNRVCLNSNTSCGTPCLHIPTDSVHSIHPQSASIHP